MDAYCLDRYSWKRMHRMPLLRAQRAIDCAEVAPVASTTIPATFQPALRPPGQRRGEAAPAVRGHLLGSHSRGRPAVTAASAQATASAMSLSRIRGDGGQVDTGGIGGKALYSQLGRGSLSFRNRTGLCGRGYSGPQRCHAVCRVSSRTTQTPADKPPSGSIVALSGRLPGRPTRARPSWLAWDLSPAQGV